MVGESSQVVCQPRCERDQRESRIGMTARGKHRAARDVEVVNFVHTAVSVDDPVRGRGGHASRAEVVVAGMEVREVELDLLFEVIVVRVELTCSRRGQLRREKAMKRRDSADVLIVERNPHFESRHAERIAILGEHDPARAVREMLGVVLDGEVVDRLWSEDSRKASALEVPSSGDQRRVPQQRWGTANDSPPM